jgi:flagellar biosynthesis protein FlhG
VLIDSGNGPSEPTIRLWQAASDVLLVTTPDAVAVMDTYATVKTLLSRSAIGCPVRMIVNRADSEDMAADVHRRIDHSCQRFLGLSLPLAGWMPSEPMALAALRRGQPIVLAHPDCQLTHSIERLAESLLAVPTQPASQHRRAA